MAQFLNSILLAGLVVMGTAAAATPAPVQKWVTLEALPDAVIYIDPASIKQQGNWADMWVLIDYKQPQDDRTGKKVKSDTLHYRYDCSGRQFSVVASSAYAGAMGSGAVVDVTADPQLNPVPPGTTAERMWQHACAR